MKQTSVKLVKKSRRIALELPAKMPFVRDQNGGSKGFRSWVDEFRRRDHNKPLSAFANLFKDEIAK